MFRTALGIAALTIAAFGVTRMQDPPLHPLKEERMTLEYTSAIDEVALVVEAESEDALDHVEIRNPSGALLLDLRASAGRGLGLSGFRLETREGGFGSFFASYPEGIYEMRAWTVQGNPLRGHARLTHDLLAPPILKHPVDGQLVSPVSSLLVAWDPDPGASGYRVTLEQNENDGLTVHLPAGAGSFLIPEGVLLPGLESRVEVAAVSPAGNCTLTEAIFRTR